MGGADKCNHQDKNAKPFSLYHPRYNLSLFITYECIKSILTFGIKCSKTIIDCPSQAGK
jgi:hypothetical protein